jgi:biotin transport system substrate-specific component
MEHDMTKLNQMIRIAAMTAVLCVSVYAVPPIIVFGSVPFTIQTFVIFLIAFLFNKNDAFMTVTLYLMLGLLGLPVFSGGTSGLSAILGPTGGFLVLFPIVTYGISRFKSKDKRFVHDFLMTFFFGIVILYGFSAIWLAYVLSLSYLNALLILLPFVPLDIIKVLIAHTVYRKMPSLYELSTH